MRLWVDPLSSTIQLSPPSGCPRWQSDDAGRFSTPWLLTSHPGWTLCIGIVEPFKHPLHATTHPQFIVLELRAPMGACPGQYGTTILYTSIMVWSHHPIILQTPPVCSMMTQCLFKAQSSSLPSCLSTVSQVISHRDKCSRRCTQHCTRCGKY